MIIIALGGACQESSSKSSTTQTAKAQVKDSVLVLSINQLMKQAMLCDSMTYTNVVTKNASNGVLYFKSGHVFHSKYKHVLLICKEPDATFTLATYFDDDGTWKLKDHITQLDLNPTQFNIKFQDFNFDNQIDCYIQVSHSNGYAISRGHLIIIDPNDYFPVLHKEARNLGNLRVVGQHIESEEWEGYDKDATTQIKTYRYQWVGGLLKRIF